MSGAEEDAFGSMDLTKRITQDLEGNLHILSVEPEDENDGEPYVCNAFNPIMRSIQQGDDQIVKIKVWEAGDCKDLRSGIVQILDFFRSN